MSFHAGLSRVSYFRWSRICDGEQQLQKYYRKVDFSSVQYAKIPTQEKVKTTSHYTKETNQKLQESLMDSDDDILDF